MKAKTAKALENSIAHWRRMRNDPFGGELPFASDCALCLVTGRDCPMCPTECTGIYTRAALAWHVLRRLPHSKTALAAWNEAADAEIAHLESARE